MGSESDDIRPRVRLFDRAKRLLSTPRRLVIIAALLVLAAGGWWLAAQRSPVNQGVAALKRAYRLQRPFEARISGFDYAPLVQVRGEKPFETDIAARERAERLLLDVVYENPNPSALHALGRSYLARRDFKQAIEHFTRALEAIPGNASLHNDLGVALMEKSKAASDSAESGENIEQLAIALGHFNKALELNRDLPEAVFNRTLLYQQMLLKHKAGDEWQEYLRRDATSRWSDEARQNLQQLEDSRTQAPQTPAQVVQSLRQAQERNDDEQAWGIVSQNRDRIGSVVVRVLLEDYLAALSKKDSGEADRLLSSLSYVGGLSERMAGDRFVSDLTSYYRLAASSRPERLGDLLNARDFLRLGLEDFEKRNIQEAAERFTKAKQQFDRLGNTGEALQAEFMFARCLRQQAEIKVRSDIYQRLSKVCARTQYRWLHTQVLMVQVMTQLGLANQSNVIKRSKEGLKIAQASRDAHSSAAFLLQAAEAYKNLGDYHKSLKLYFEGLSLVNRYRVNPEDRWGLYLLIGQPLNALGQHAAAVEYQEESLRLARASGNLRQICRSYMNLAVTYGYLRNHKEATRNAQLAFELAQKIPAGYGSTENVAQASLRLGQLYNQAGDFHKATENFDRAIQLYEGLDSQEAFKYEAYKGKLISSLAQGASQSLEEEIKMVLNLFEKYRVRINEESNRNSFFDVEQSVYDIAIDFWHSAKKDPGTAFELAEHSRARSLLDSVSSASLTIQDAANPDLRHDHVSPPMKLAEIQERMPAQTQILQYAVLKDRLLIWFVSRAQPIVLQEQKISSSELSQRVSDYLKIVAKGPTDDQSTVKEASRQLHRLLIQPVAPLLDEGKQLCIVPDKVLNQLPYAALVSQDSDRFLIEDYSLIFAPSATMFVLSSEAATAKEKVKVEKLMSVGDPAFDRQAFSLNYLPSARREAEAISAYYHQPDTLIGKQATKQRVADEIERCDVLHMALHCVVDKRSPMRSKLLLAKGEKHSDDAGETDDVLQAFEIYRLPLRRLRLVVLAACLSGVERYYSGEGMIGLSRPFIAKGVPLVVASLWEVDSSATTELMTRFHASRKLKSLPTSEALRQAQLSMLRGSDTLYRQPYYWASFESIGGYAKF